MPGRLKRIYGFRDLHFITSHPTNRNGGLSGSPWSCYRRLPLLGNKHARDAFRRIFEQVRRKCKFEVVGYASRPINLTSLMRVLLS